MNESEITTIVTGLVTITGLVIGYLKLRLQARDTKQDIADVHTLVNTRSDKQDARIDQLTGTLNTAGIPVPDHLTES